MKERLKMPFLAFMYILFAIIPMVFALHAHAQTATVQLSAEEYQFYETINQFRANLHLPTLQIHTYLQNAAKKHSDWMAAQDTLTHFGPNPLEAPFQRMNLEGYVNYTIAGENIACGYSDAMSTFRQFAFSPGHLANMINPHFHHFGITRSGTGNEQCPYYWTNDFGSMTDTNQDPAEVTDLNLITQAIVAVSGPLDGNVVHLPSAATPEPTTP